MQHSRILIISLCIVLPLFPLAAQEAAQAEAAPAPTDQGASPANDKSSLAETLKPSFLALGVLPTLDGFIDGRLDSSLRWTPWMGSNLRFLYSSSSELANESDDTTVLNAKVFSKDYRAQIDVLEVLIPFPAAKGGGLALGASVGARWEGNDESLSGYRQTSEETVYFNQNRFIHRMAPTLHLSLLGTNAGAGSPRFNFTVKGSFFPWVGIFESGEKVYSTWEDPIPFELWNNGMGWQAQVELASIGFRLVDISLAGSVVGLFGNYTSRQSIISGNWLTTIETSAAWERYECDSTLDIALPFLRKRFKIIPVLSLAYRITIERFDELAPSWWDSWKLGFSVRSL